MPRPYSPLLFDLDGTLIDSVADLATAVNLLRGELDLAALDNDAVRMAVGDGARELVRRTLPDGAFTEVRMHRFLQLYAAHLVEQTTVYPGMRELLDTFAPGALAIVTNKPLALTLLLLDALDLARHFGAVIGGDSCPAKKPSPLPLQLALHRLGADPARGLMIGDHHTDLRAGQAAGIATCFCAWGYGHDDGLEPEHRASSVPELARLLA